MIPGLFAVFNGLTSFLVQLAELNTFSSSPINLFDIFRGYIISSLDWNVTKTNFYNPLSICTAISIHLCFISIIFNQWQHLKIKPKSIMTSFLIGSIPVFTYAVMQIKRIIPIKYTRLIGGTFQNGNHLSFYAGLLILLSFYLLMKEKRINRFLFFLLVSIPFFLIGGSKTAWISMAAVLISYSMFFVYYIVTNLRQNSKKDLFPLLLLAILLLAFLGYDYLSKDFAFLTNFWKGEIVKAASVLGDFFTTGSLQILQSGGRFEHLNYALNSIYKYFMLGRGLGNFYTLSESGYELHYPYLHWLYSMGIGGLISMLIGIGVFIHGLLNRLISCVSKEEKYQEKVLSFILMSGIILYIGCSHITDTFMSYIPILSIISIIIIIFIKEHFPLGSKLYNHNLKRLSIAVTTAGLLTGSLTLFSPHSRTVYGFNQPISNLSLNQEYTANIDFTFDVDQNECKMLQVHSLVSTESNALPINIYELTNLPPRFYNFSERNTWQANNAKFRSSIYIWPAQWNNLCLCKISARKNENTLIQLSALHGSIKNIERESPFEEFYFHSFISIFSGTETYSDTFPSNFICHYAIML